eukprot:10816-Pelagococcus_subviridis.AAC.4
MKFPGCTAPSCAFCAAAAATFLPLTPPTDFVVAPTAPNALPAAVNDAWSAPPPSAPSAPPAAPPTTSIIERSGKLSNSRLHPFMITNASSYARAAASSVS